MADQSRYQARQEQGHQIVEELLRQADANFANLPADRYNTGMLPRRFDPCMSNPVIPVAVQQSVDGNHDSVWAAISRQIGFQSDPDHDQEVTELLGRLQGEVPFNLNVVPVGYTFAMSHDGLISALPGGSFHTLGTAADWDWCKRY